MPQNGVLTLRLTSPRVSISQHVPHSQSHLKIVFDSIIYVRSQFKRVSYVENIQGSPNPPCGPKSPNYKGPLPRIWRCILECSRCSVCIGNVYALDKTESAKHNAKSGGPSVQIWWGHFVRMGWGCTQNFVRYRPTKRHNMVCKVPQRHISAGVKTHRVAHARTNKYGTAPRFTCTYLCAT
jgi:hypothetical protein